MSLTTALLVGAALAIPTLAVYGAENIKGATGPEIPILEKYNSSIPEPLLLTENNGKIAELTKSPPLLPQKSESVSEPASEPVSEPVSEEVELPQKLESASEPASEPASEEEQSSEGKKGGAIGLPEWGQLKTPISLPSLPNIPIPGVPGGLSSLVPVDVTNPVELQLKLSEINKKVENLSYTTQELKTKIAASINKYKKENEKYADSYAKNQQFSTLFKITSEKLSKSGKKELSKQEKENKIKELRKEGKTEDEAKAIVNEQSGLQLDDKQIEILQKNLYEYSKKKTETDFEKEEAELLLKEERTKFETNRKKVLDNEKELVELKKQRQTILEKLSEAYTPKPKELPYDFEKRRKVYILAKENYEQIVQRLKDFYNFVYTDEKASLLKDKKQELESQLNFAKRELDKAIYNLTVLKKENQTFGSIELSNLSSELQEIFGNEIISNDKLLNSFVNILNNPLLQKFVSVLNEISTEKDLQDNSSRYLTFFKEFNQNFPEKYYNTIIDYKQQLKNIYQGIKNENPPDQIINEEQYAIRPIEITNEQIQQDILNKKTKLAEGYKEARLKLITFIDKQIFLINSFGNVIKTALRSIRTRDLTYKNLKEIEKLSIQKTPRGNEGILQPIILPQQNTCEIRLPYETYSLLKSGKFNQKDILELLNSQKEEDFADRQAFFDKIGFGSISDQTDFVDFTRRLYTRLGQENYTILIDSQNFKLLEQQLKEQKSGTRNYIYSKNELRTIEAIIKDCDILLNIGKGPEEHSKIKLILEKLRDFGKVIVTSDLDTFIKAEELSGRINIDRGLIMKGRNANPALIKTAIGTLHQKGFRKPFDYFSILKITIERGDKNIIDAFLTLRSSKFRSIPYKSQTIYNGKRRLTREVFIELFEKELEKQTPFRKVPKFMKATTQDEKFIESLCILFDLDIFVFNDLPSDKRITSEFNSGNPQNPQREVLYMFKDRDGIYYPVIIQSKPPELKDKQDDLTRFFGDIQQQAPPTTSASAGTPQSIPVISGTGLRELLEQLQSNPKVSPSVAIPPTVQPPQPPQVLQVPKVDKSKTCNVVFDEYLTRKNKTYFELTTDERAELRQSLSRPPNNFSQDDIETCFKQREDKTNEQLSPEFNKYLPQLAEIKQLETGIITNDKLETNLIIAKNKDLLDVYREFLTHKNQGVELEELIKEGKQLNTNLQQFRDFLQLKVLVCDEIIEKYKVLKSKLSKANQDVINLRIEIVTQIKTQLTTFIDGQFKETSTNINKSLQELVDKNQATVNQADKYELQKEIEEIRSSEGVNYAERKARMDAVDSADPYDYINGKIVGTKEYQNVMIDSKQKEILQNLSELKTEDVFKKFKNDETYPLLQVLAKMTEFKNIAGTMYTAARKWPVEPNKPLTILQLTELWSKNPCYQQERVLQLTNNISIDKATSIDEPEDFILSKKLGRLDNLAATFINGLFVHTAFLDINPNGTLKSGKGTSPRIQGYEQCMGKKEGFMNPEEVLRKARQMNSLKEKEDARIKKQEKIKNALLTRVQETGRSKLQTDQTEALKVQQQRDLLNRVEGEEQPNVKCLDSVQKWLTSLPVQNRRSPTAEQIRTFIDPTNPFYQGERVTLKELLHCLAFYKLKIPQEILDEQVQENIKKQQVEVERQREIDSKAQALLAKSREERRKIEPIIAKNKQTIQQLDTEILKLNTQIERYLPTNRRVTVLYPDEWYDNKIEQLNSQKEDKTARKFELEAENAKLSPRETNASSVEPRFGEGRTPHRKNKGTRRTKKILKTNA